MIQILNEECNSDTFYVNANDFRNYQIPHYTSLKYSQSEYLRNVLHKSGVVLNCIIFSTYRFDLNILKVSQYHYSYINK